MSAIKAAKRTNVMSIIKAYSGKDAVIAIPRVYIEMCGDYNRAAVLNQILYWSERTSTNDGWFYKSYDEWEMELGLTRYQIKRAVEGDKRAKDTSKALVNIGVETALRKAPNGAPTIHYRIDETVFMEHLNKAIESMKTKQKVSNINNVEKPILNIVENGNETLSQMDIQQRSKSINTESTSENTNKDIDSASAEKTETPPLGPSNDEQPDEPDSSDNTDAPDKPKKKQEVLGDAFGVQPVTGQDWGLYGKVCKQLTEAGIEPSEYPDYIAWVRKLAKGTGGWKVTIPSLISGGRVSDYVSTKKQAQEKTTTSLPTTTDGERELYRILMQSQKDKSA